MAKGENKDGAHRDAIAQALTIAARRHRAAIAAELNSIGLFPGQEQVLRLLSMRDGMTMGEVAENLKVRPPTASKMVARLAGQSLVERRGTSSDARVISVHLTDTGRARAGGIDVLLQAVEDRATQGLDSKDIRRLRKLLKRIAKNLSSHESETEDETDD